MRHIHHFVYADGRCCLTPSESVDDPQALFHRKCPHPAAFQPTERDLTGPCRWCGKRTRGGKDYNHGRLRQNVKPSADVLKLDRAFRQRLERG